MKNIKTITLLSLLLCTIVANAEDVTSKYIQNPDFGARFAGWINPGSFTYNVANTFAKRNGEVWMEKWVSSGSKLNTNAGIYQTLRGLQDGTYTLTVAAKNVQQANASQVCTGAFLYAGNNQVEIGAEDDYSVEFTVANGKIDIGVKTASCTGNWFCVDNFRLEYNGVDEAKLAAEKTRVAEELATLQTNLENATGKVPIVKTETFVATGVTIALARATFTANGSTIKERGICWSTNPEPTILDDRTTTYFNNNGNIYRIEGLQPATAYYVRAYAITNGWQVGYGEPVKIVTMPQGNVACGYDYAGSEEEDFRINSAMQECVWMYNNLANIRGLYLNVHYVPGAGAGDGTADCSYGGWMRVSQKNAYQQTGTLLHETNHGVGVGTTGEWYNNSNLRGSTTRGLWLGPRATDMVRFFENSTTATMTGDGTHMWPYGINGAQEDRYQPSDQCLYFANILITHAMHQDGLIATSQVGFATPAYVFRQDDNKKYYIKCEEEKAGGLTSYLGMTSTGALKCYQLTSDEVVANDDYAWQITYDPATSYYIFYNVGQQKYLTNASSTIKAVKKTSATATEKFHLMPSRNPITMGKYTGQSFWILTASGHKAMQGSTVFSSSSNSYNVQTQDFDPANAATSQRWVLLEAEEAQTYDSGAASAALSSLNDLIKNVRAVMAVPHLSATEEAEVSALDATLETVIAGIEAEKDGYTSPAQVRASLDALQDAFLAFLADVTPVSVAEPFDLSFLLNNASLYDNAEGWSQTAAHNYHCVEFFQKSFDFNQTTSVKLPAATYEVKANAFQRPGAYAAVYTDYVKNGTNNVDASLYAKTKTVKLKNIYDDAQTRTQGTGSVAAATKVYIPDTQESANNYFSKGFYENSVMVTTTTTASLKLGIKGTNTGTGFWTCFNNFRLLSHGKFTIDDVTPVAGISANQNKSTVAYDLSGRRVSVPGKGLYIVNGKKVLY